MENLVEQAEKFLEATVAPVDHSVKGQYLILEFDSADIARSAMSAYSQFTPQRKGHQLFLPLTQVARRLVNTYQNKAYNPR